MKSAYWKSCWDAARWVVGYVADIGIACFLALVGGAAVSGIMWFAFWSAGHAAAWDEPDVKQNTASIISLMLALFFAVALRSLAYYRGRDDMEQEAGESLDARYRGIRDAE